MKNDKSMRDVAYELIKANKNEPIQFPKLFDKVAEELEMSPEEKEDRISDFYTDLTMDGRFVTFDGESWDLRENHLSDTVTFRPLETEEETDEDEEDKEEAKEFESKINGGSSDDEVQPEDGDEESDEKFSAHDLGVNI